MTRLAAVIKVGGGLSAEAGALAAVGAAIARAAKTAPVLVVPGGGPFADLVRATDAREALSAESAHWMAVAAMDQYAYVVAHHLPGAVVIDDPPAIPRTLAAGAVPVLAPGRWLRAADPLPHSWEVTSDSLAAWIAGALDAEELILIKAVTPTPGQELALVDAAFPTTLPHDLPWRAIGWRDAVRAPLLP